MQDEPENLDGLSIDPTEYEAYAADENNDPLLRGYAASKAEAMTHRAAGRIETALQTERLLEHIYNTLPAFLKW